MLFISLYMIGMYKETTSPSHICFGSRRQWLPLSECSRCRTAFHRQLYLQKHHCCQASERRCARLPGVPVVSAETVKANAPLSQTPFQAKTYSLA